LRHSAALFACGSKVLADFLCAVVGASRRKLHTIEK
jgi:hypothetical protein